MSLQKCWLISFCEKTACAKNVLYFSHATFGNGMNLVWENKRNKNFWQPLRYTKTQKILKMSWKYTSMVLISKAVITAVWTNIARRIKRYIFFGLLDLLHFKCVWNSLKDYKIYKYSEAQRQTEKLFPIIILTVWLLHKPEPQMFFIKYFRYFKTCTLH